jgi:hypothetical protein
LYHTLKHFNTGPKNGTFFRITCRPSSAPVFQQTERLRSSDCGGTATKERIEKKLPNKIVNPISKDMRTPQRRNKKDYQ